MKSTHKLEFTNKAELGRFCDALFMKIRERDDWYANCDYFSRNNVLYVDTHRYTCIEIFLQNWRFMFNYNVVELFNKKGRK